MRNNWLFLASTPFFFFKHSFLTSPNVAPSNSGIVKLSRTNLGFFVFSALAGFTGLSSGASCYPLSLALALAAALALQSAYQSALSQQLQFGRALRRLFLAVFTDFEELALTVCLRSSLPLFARWPVARAQHSLSGQLLVMQPLRWLPIL